MPFEGMARFDDARADFQFTITSLPFTPREPMWA